MDDAIENVSTGKVCSMEEKLLFLQRTWLDEGD